MINKKTALVFIFFFSIFLTGLLWLSSAHARESGPGIVLSDDHGNILFSQNTDRQYIPASILKILTSFAAITILGPGYRFPTDFYFDKNLKNLYIKGFGDPLFISEVIDQFCRDIILKTKIKQINHIILDQTYFSDSIRIPGRSNSLNPYDAQVGALCANFNTIMFKWNESAGRFISAEAQTPLLPIFNTAIKKTRMKKGRIILTKDQSILYPGLLIKYFLEKKNIISGPVLQGNFTIRQGQKYSFLSPFKTKEIVQKLLKYSSNYIANQLLLSLGAKKYGSPATLEKGIKMLKVFAKQEFNLNGIQLAEGSGLSRSNLISPSQMLRVLLKFMPYHTLLRHKDNDFFKTGTLSGIRTRAGYILGNDNRLYPYVIMVNQKNKGYGSIRKNLLNRVSQMIHHPIGQ